MKLVQLLFKANLLEGQGGTYCKIPHHHSCWHIVTFLEEGIIIIDANKLHGILKIGLFNALLGALFLNNDRNW